ncbi:MAG: hypothetical protein KJ697_03455 [Nanoarchaeota archaeon]|nr:hypothetical protein [Nanoarchaeota archaeon]MBU4124170.1 hypothetical protein [Nanoarchaeota archaeon]
MVSNNVLAGLVAVVLVLSVVSIGSTMSLIGGTSSATGMAIGTAQVSVPAKVAISLPVNAIDFGNMDVNDANDTIDTSPAPFQVQNDGSVSVNITVGADDMWTGTGATNPSVYYKFACGAGEVACGSGSVTSLTNMPATGSPIKAIANLGHTNAADQVELDIGVTVPSDEPAGSKSSTVTFTASQA